MLRKTSRETGEAVESNTPESIVCDVDDRDRYIRERVRREVLPDLRGRLSRRHLRRRNWNWPHLELNEFRQIANLSESRHWFHDRLVTV